MERLTHYLRDGRTAAEPKNRAEGLAFAAKLAAYEDAEENGTLIKLPCKVGDRIYYVNKESLNLSVQANTIYDAEVVRIVTTRLGTSLVIQIHNEYGCTEFPNINDWGKTVFFTREEAEKALKERDSE